MGKTHARAQTAPGLVFDTGALIALDRCDKRMVALIGEAVKQGRVVRVPAGVVAQAWRDGRVQAFLARFLRMEEVQIISLDQHLARSCGELCRASRTADVIDASVAILGRKFRGPIVTSDPKDLLRLDPNAELIVL